MIETIVGCASAGLLLLFIEKVVISGSSDNQINAIKEKRRILERDREVYFGCWERARVGNSKNRTELMSSNYAQIMRIDKELLKLADELKNIR